MGYIISDMTIIIANYRVIGDAFTLAHHIATVFGYAHSLVSKQTLIITLIINIDKLSI